ncbi:hypothetical protein lerEdw1_003361 [Lerista edwardsae]|nr:hypothetical protein lerEdw1_003361 [Lerista edwardsae]
MGRKRLITDSFQVVKKRKRDSKAKSPPREIVTVQAEPVLQDAIQPDQLETLKQFDLSWEYGPCTGITRLQRWERAKLLGLSPPAMVQELLLKYREDSVIMHRNIKALERVSIPLKTYSLLSTTHMLYSLVAKSPSSRPESAE